MDELGLAGAERDDEYGRYTQGHRYRAADRADEMGGYAANDARRTDRFGEVQMDGMERAVAGDEYIRNARAAIANFTATGNPVALEDFYNNMYPDDGQVTIEKLPDGKYRGTFSNGETREVTKEELIKGSEQFFMSHPQASESGYGMGIGMPGMSVSGPRGSYSRGGIGTGARGTGYSSSKPSAYREKVEMLANSLMQNEGMNRIEALAQAHREASYSSRTPPDEAAREFYADILPELLPDRDMMMAMSPEEQEAAYAEAESRAQQITENYLSNSYKGYNQEGSGIGGGETGGGDQSFEVPQEHIDALMADPSDQTKAFFDEVYGEGAAEAVLNGN
jgi:hypothetical protein